MVHFCSYIETESKNTSGDTDNSAKFIGNERKEYDQTELK